MFGLYQREHSKRHTSIVLRGLQIDTNLGGYCPVSLTNRADCQWFAIGLQWVRVRSASDPRLNIQGLAQGYYFKLPEGRKVAIEAAVHTEKFSSGLMSPRGDHFSLSRLQGNSEVVACLCAESPMHIYSWISHTVMRRMCGGPGTRLLPTFAATTIVTLALTKQ